MQTREMNSPGQEFVAMDRMLDQAVSGPFWLKDTRIAKMVCEVIQEAESTRQLCRLAGYVVMSNRVHLLARMSHQ